MTLQRTGRTPTAIDKQWFIPDSGFSVGPLARRRLGSTMDASSPP
jgi:hypothetical protein